MSPFQTVLNIFPKENLYTILAGFTTAGGNRKMKRIGKMIDPLIKIIPRVI